MLRWMMSRVAAMTQDAGLMGRPRLLHIHEQVDQGRNRPRPDVVTKHNVWCPVKFSTPWSGACALPLDMRSNLVRPDPANGVVLF